MKFILYILDMICIKKYKEYAYNIENVYINIAICTF